MDTVGIAQVMTMLANVDTGTVDQFIPAGSTDVEVTEVSFTLNRAAAVMMFYSMTLNASGNFAYGSAPLDGSAAGPTAGCFLANGLSYNSGSHLTTAFLTAGEHTAGLTVSTSPGITSYVYRGQVIVFLTGA